MKRTTHLVFTGGGTGGHLFPGLAVARQLTTEVPRLRITFAGSGKEFERRQVAAAGFDYCALPCRPLPRGAREAFSFVVENLAGYLVARRFLKDEDVAAVIGLGGYASVPMGRAAVRTKVPLILLEQNVVPGKATRWLARSASLICTSFAETEASLRCRCPIRLTGNPVRFTAMPEGASSASRGGQLLVLGGSGGARWLNENVPRALYKAKTQLTDWRILHQTGEADAEATRELYRKLALEAAVVPFIADLPDVLTQTDLAICRAGGTTLAELAVAGVPGVLLPYPHATDDHQRRNAEVFAAGGGAVLLDEREIPGRPDDCLAEVVAILAGDGGRRAAMSAAMRSLARPEAAADAAWLIWSVASTRAKRVRTKAAV